MQVKSTSNFRKKALLNQDYVRTARTEGLPEMIVIFKHVFESVLMRIVNMQLAFPFLLLALTMVAILGSSIMNVVLVLSIPSWISYVKVVRSSVLSVKF